MTVELAERYHRDGVVSQVEILTPTEAAEHRASMEKAEKVLGNLHYRDKVHTVLSSAWDLCIHRTVLDAVEAMIGPDILVYNATYIIKEPGAKAFVAWHQDLTYWGLEDHDAQVSMWLALSPATAESGCMSMIPGSHLDGWQKHVEDNSDDNVLLLGQRIENVDPANQQLYPLQSGQASFHHGWTVHTSNPNVSEERRIGLNVQYLAPHNRQVGVDASAILVRGTDTYGYFTADTPPASNLDSDAVARWHDVEQRMKQGFQTRD